MKNNTNISKYYWLSFVYDWVIKNHWFERARKREFELAQIQKSDHVLIVGIGTGLDLAYLSTETPLVGIDLSPSMLKNAKEKSRQHHLSLHQMSAESIQLPDANFDIIIMNLILSVVENPQLALREAERLLKPNGSIWILDKFSNQTSILRRISNQVTSLLGTDITRSLNSLIQDHQLEITYTENAFWGSTYQIIQCKRKNPTE